MANQAMSFLELAMQGVEHGIEQLTASDDKEGAQIYLQAANVYATLDLAQATREAVHARGGGGQAEEWDNCPQCGGRKKARFDLCYNCNQGGGNQQNYGGQQYGGQPAQQQAAQPAQPARPSPFPARN